MVEEQRPTSSQPQAVPSTGGGARPVFHIAAFRDLAAASRAARKAAAKQTVLELKAVQSAYNAREENDDESDNCAPAVKYAVQRLVSGLSKSTEVCDLYLSF
ncbi:hypothetical protein LR48_Vigan09g264700 [Vigna angularis]|uniref:Uncharacterized protein n=1 Tax=Phaseolus angularis TaxID=3914 RepID=A0A0L9VG76_PHAAN|nr:hypothetical protein LR48_Vigan09g264700 [Vigna angularis]